MRLVHVVDRVTAIGGVQTYLAGLLPALAEHGVESSIVVGSGTPGSYAGAEVRVSPGVLADAAELESEERVHLRATLEDLAPEAVYVHVALSPAIVREVALVASPVVYAHDYFMTCPGNARYLQRRQSFCAEGLGLRCFVRAYTERSMNRRPDRMLHAYRRARAWQATLPQLPKVLVASEFVARVLLDAGAAPASVTVVPYPVVAGPALASPGARVDVLFVGRLIATKGADTLIEAVSRLDGVSLAVAGDGPERPRLEKLAGSLGIAGRVRFLGWVSSLEREEMLAGARVLALPSRWEEPFGIVGLEALAAGIPVVATAVGGIPSWLRDGEAGLLVPPSDPSALAAGLARVLGEDDLRARLAARAPDVVERFSMARHLELLLPELRAAAS